MRHSDQLALGLALALSLGGQASAQSYAPVDARGGAELVRAVHLPDGRVVYESVNAATPPEAAVAPAPPDPPPPPRVESATLAPPSAVQPSPAPALAAVAPPAPVERQALASPPPLAAVGPLVLEDPAPAPKAFIPAAADRPGSGATDFAASELPAPPLDPMQVRVNSGAAAVDIFTLRSRPGLILDPRLGAAYDLDYTYTGPGLVRMSSGRYGLDVRPQWGFGVSSFNGSSTHAGAVVRFGRDLADDAVDAYGARHGQEVRGKNRWFLYAGASGKAFSWNVMPGLDGRRDLAFEEGGGFVGTAQAGLAWRAGDLTASIGYAHDKARLRLFGARSESDDRFGLFFSYRPAPPKPRLTLEPSH